MKNHTLHILTLICSLSLLTVGCPQEETGGNGSDTSTLNDASGDTGTTTDTGTGNNDASTGGCQGPDPSVTCTTDDECGAGNVCRPAGCVPSSCSCDEATGVRTCTSDCGLGQSTCVPEGTLTTCTSDADCTQGQEWCEGGECVACDNSGLLCDIACEEGSSTYTRNGCSPCDCKPVNTCASDSDCTTGQGGSLCIPGSDCLDWCPAGDPTCCYGSTCQDGSGSACSTDADCTKGQEWCEGGRCVTCDNSGLVCFIQCAEGEELYTRNECSPCDCRPITDCTSDADCGSGEVCQAGEECLFWCPAGDPSCCYGNTCVATP